MYLLDTNIVSVIVTKRSARALERFLAVRNEPLCMSVITLAELLFGMARRPEAYRFNSTVTAFIADIEIVAWSEDAAQAYAALRAAMEAGGRSLGAMDMLIAAQAAQIGAILVTADKAFRHVPGLAVEDWTV